MVKIRWLVVIGFLFHTNIVCPLHLGVFCLLHMTPIHLPRGRLLRSPRFFKFLKDTGGLAVPAPGAVVATHKGACLAEKPRASRSCFIRAGDNPKREYPTVRRAHASGGVVIRIVPALQGALVAAGPPMEKKGEAL